MREKEKPLILFAFDVVILSQFMRFHRYSASLCSSLIIMSHKLPI